MRSLSGEVLNLADTPRTSQMVADAGLNLISMIEQLLNLWFFHGHRCTRLVALNHNEGRTVSRGPSSDNGSLRYRAFASIMGGTKSVSTPKNPYSSRRYVGRVQSTLHTKRTDGTLLTRLSRPSSVTLQHCDLEPFRRCSRPVVSSSESKFHCRELSARKSSTRRRNPAATPARSGVLVLHAAVADLRLCLTRHLLHFRLLGYGCPAGQHP